MFSVQVVARVFIARVARERRRSKQNSWLNSTTKRKTVFQLSMRHNVKIPYVTHMFSRTFYVCIYYYYCCCCCYYYLGVKLNENVDHHLLRLLHEGLGCITVAHEQKQ